MMHSPPAVLQVRLRGLGIAFFILCVVIYTFGAWGLVQPSTWPC